MRQNIRSGAGDDTRRPLLIVNGFSLLPMPLVVARKVYGAAGFRPYTIDFRFRNMRDVEAYARRVAEAVSLIRSECPGTGRLDIIGFSMGGVATLYAIKRLGLDRQVSRFIAVGAPFRGATISLLAFPSLLYTRTGRQLMPKSRFLASLHADPLPDGPRYVAFAGSRDTICPAERSTLDGAENVVLPFRHIDFLVSPAFHRSILEYLA